MACLKNDNLLKILPSDGFYYDHDGKKENQNLIEENYLGLSKFI